MADDHKTGQIHPDLDEEALVRGLIARDPDLVADFLTRTHRPVYAMSGRLTADPEQRHDWTHDVLLKVLEDLARGAFVYRWPGSFWSWFRTRTYYLLINEYRRHKQHHDRWTTGEVGEAVLARLPMKTGTEPMDLIEAVQARAVIEDCVGRLPSDDQRRALRLLLLEDHSYQSVADVLGATLNTVRSWIRRARIAVRRCVASAYGITLEDRR